MRKTGEEKIKAIRQIAANHEGIRFETVLSFGIFSRSDAAKIFYSVIHDLIENSLAAPQKNLQASMYI